VSQIWPVPVWSRVCRRRSPNFQWAVDCRIIVTRHHVGRAPVVRRLPSYASIIIIVKTASKTALRVQHWQLGHTDLPISLPILGGTGMGDKGYQPWVFEEEEALPILKKVYDRGLNTWGTCCSCSNGVSKEILSCRLARPARDQSTARVI